tara:strand:+ start:1441 stop:1620 length:180 start_codon:yes stop_codon:yes gene_type:complete
MKFKLKNKKEAYFLLSAICSLHEKMADDTSRDQETIDKAQEDLTVIRERLIKLCCKKGW